MNNQTAGKILTGVVTSTKQTKTVVVRVGYQYRHPLYKKAMNRSKKFAVHYEGTGLAVGDTVRIQETKPISRRKHFIVLSKIK